MSRFFAEEEIRCFQDMGIAVIGDIMLDVWLRGKLHSYCSRTGMPKIAITERLLSLGGAANVANNVKSLNGRPLLVGVVGKESDELRQELLRAQVSDGYIVESFRRGTTTKERVIALPSLRPIVQMDHEISDPIIGDTESAVMNMIRTIIDDIDCVIISDYAKGLLTPEVIRVVYEEAEQRKLPVIVDLSPANVGLYKRASVITLNCQDLLEITNSKDIPRAVKKLLNQINGSMVLTRGAEGISVFRQNKKTVDIPTRRVPIADSTGARDTIVATLALAMGAEMNVVQAAKLANFAAGIVVQKPGIATATKHELLLSLV